MKEHSGTPFREVLSHTDTSWKADAKVLSQKNASGNGVLEPFFPGTDITNTILSLRSLAHYVFSNLFSLEKYVH
jgi:hypothetical protein